MQSRLLNGMTLRECVDSRAWRRASPEACPVHGKGRCSFARHGTYVRKTPCGEAHGSALVLPGQPGLVLPSARLSCIRASGLPRRSGGRGGARGNEPDPDREGAGGASEPRRRREGGAALAAGRRMAGGFKRRGDCAIRGSFDAHLPNAADDRRIEPGDTPRGRHP